MSVRHTLIFVLFACFCFQAECPLCREPVQLSRLVFLHHYEPTWPTTETHFDTVCWEAFKYNQSGCRQLWAVHFLNAWVDARVACLLKYWSLKTPTNCSDNTSHSRDSFLELRLRSLHENLEPGNKTICTKKQSTVNSQDCTSLGPTFCTNPWSSRYSACPKIFQSWDLKLASRSVKQTNKQTQSSVG